MLATPDIRQLNSAQLDALREVANIGAGHAATALSTMTRQAIMINVPTITIAALHDIPSQVVTSPNDRVAVVLLQMLGDLTGQCLMVFPEATARRLAELMLHRPRGSSPWIATLEQSALKECGNILSGAYLNALARFMHLRLLPSPPTIAIDAAHVVLERFAERADVVFCVESEFEMRETADVLRGYFLLAPDAASLQSVLQSLKLA
jgi:chemotaxis protein CheC